MDEQRIRKAAGAMKRQQLHRRMDWRTVWSVVEYFVLKKMPVAKTMEWLGLSRSQVYSLKSRWLKTRESGGPTKGWLYQRPGTGESRLPQDVQAYLGEELRYIQTEASAPFRGH